MSQIVPLERKQLAVTLHLSSRKCAQVQIHPLETLFPLPFHWFGTRIATARGNLGLPMAGNATMADSETIQSVKQRPKPFAPIEAQIKRAIGRIAESDCPV